MIQLSGQQSTNFSAPCSLNNLSIHLDHLMKKNGLHAVSTQEEHTEQKSWIFQN